ncbi:MAG TPA: hypothetical protein VL306_03060 [Methylomirabilota bacterium]|jgi:hypothetical protein|nr:hypothetical protein [Methylomirabilota bacterium]
MKKYNMSIHVPVSHAEKIRAVLATSGAGKMGNYDACSFSIRGVGRFRPLKGANPAIGEINQLAEVEEERIETIVTEDILDSVIHMVREAHPYEQPAIDVTELKDYEV